MLNVHILYTYFRQLARTECLIHYRAKMYQPIRLYKVIMKWHCISAYVIANDETQPIYTLKWNVRPPDETNSIWTVCIRQPKSPHNRVAEKRGSLVGYTG